MSKGDTGGEVKPPVEEKEVVKESGTKYFVEKSILIKDSETGEKFVTVTISEKMLPYLFEGLAKYQETLGDSEQSQIDRKKAEAVVDELNDVKAIFNEEIIVKTKGLQEPNPVEDTTGKPEESI